MFNDDKLTVAAKSTALIDHGATRRRDHVLTRSAANIDTFTGPMWTVAPHDLARRRPNPATNPLRPTFVSRWCAVITGLAGSRPRSAAVFSGAGNP